MGMDIVGVKNTGAYFRNNVWWWHPLWSYCTWAHPDLVGPEPQLGHYNDGYGLDDEQSRKLGLALITDIRSGTVAAYKERYYDELAQLPRVDCEFCNATGIRTDSIGVQMGMPDKALDPDVASLVDRSHGYCNGCRGIGSREHHATNYPFDVENVQRFAEFLLDCGGFSIY